LKRFLALVLFAGVAYPQGRGTIYQGAMTSSGRNRPSIPITNELINICALLHRRVPTGTIAAQLNISEDELRQKLDLLRAEGLAKVVPSGITVPTAIVVTTEDAQKYFHPDEGLVESATRLLLRKLPVVKSECQKIKSLSQRQFQAESFFVMSDVLLDNWQISNVEHLVVKSERTQRTGGRYYYTILEKPSGQTAEPFGIYGNTGSQWGSVQIGLYGNDRFSGRTLLSIRDEDFNDRFGFDRAVNIRDARSELVERMLDALDGNLETITPAQRHALSQLGLMDGAEPNVLVIRGNDYKALDQVASLVTKDLVALLERYRTKIFTSYRNSIYAEEASYNEYFMCWYHFYYTSVTNRLRDKRAITIPANGNVTYFVVP
jgi:hypothetical protein